MSNRVKIEINKGQFSSKMTTKKEKFNEEECMTLSTYNGQEKKGMPLWNKEKETERGTQKNIAGKSDIVKIPAGDYMVIVYPNKYYKEGSRQPQRLRSITKINEIGNTNMNVEGIAERKCLIGAITLKEDLPRGEYRIACYENTFKKEKTDGDYNFTITMMPSTSERVEDDKQDEKDMQQAEKDDDDLPF